MSDPAPPTVGVDVDDVLADFRGVLQEGVEAEEGLTVPKRDIRQNTWDRDDGADVPEIGVDEAADRTLANDWPDGVSTFPEDLDVIDGAREGLEELAARGYEIVVVTGRSEDHREGTRAWLEANDLPHDDLRMGGDKELEPDLDVLVDDHLWNVQKFVGLGPHPEDDDVDADIDPRPGVVFDRPWSTRHVDVDEYGSADAVRVEGDGTAEQWARTVHVVEGLVQGEDIETVRAVASADGLVDAIDERFAGVGGENEGIGMDVNE